jgi:hypothetical protein
MGDFLRACAAWRLYDRLLSAVSEPPREPTNQGRDLRRPPREAIAALPPSV